MTTSETAIHCAFLGLASDPTLARSEPDTTRHCHAQQPPAVPHINYQTQFCLTEAHKECPFFQFPRPFPGEEALAGQAAGPYRRWLPLVAWAVLTVLVAVIAAIYFRDAGSAKEWAVGTRWEPTVTATISAMLQPSPVLSPIPAVAPPAQTAMPIRRFNAPTPEPGGRAVTLTGKGADAGWWTSGEASGNHLGDSFLYAGFTDNQAFISAVRFDLSAIPPGTPIRSAQLHLTGLRENRFDPAAGGAWAVQLLPASAVHDYARADFQTLLNAPANVTLLPTFPAADLGAGRVNLAAADEEGREWLEAQIQKGETGIIARIVGSGDNDSLFAWDSGVGPATGGDPPQLVLVLGAAVVTTTRLPAEVAAVATETATPANILTAAAVARAATAATESGTPAFRYITPTPSPANIATLQADALEAGLPPVIPDTPVPGNQATAQVRNMIATAEAFLTGTPTPLSPDFVTPVVVIPTPAPANVMTAAAYARTATVEGRLGTPTPWPYNAIVATLTPTFFVVVDTPAPENEATATIEAAYATAVAMLTGTFTPLPYNAVTVRITPPVAIASPTGTPTATVAPMPSPAESDAPRTEATKKPTLTSTPRPRPTSAPKPASKATATRGIATNCPDSRVQITSPRPDAVVSGRLQLRGRATHQSFAAYLVEFAEGALPAEGYEEVLRRAVKVENGLLGDFVISALPNGVYTVQLRVLTSAGDPPLPCSIAFQVNNQ